MSCASAALRTTWRCTWLSGGTSMTTSPCTCVEQERRRPAAIGWLRQYCCSTAPNGERLAARDVTPCLGNSPSASTTWQRPQRPRPPHTESMSTPSERAACSSGVPSGKRPRRPDGVKTTSASVALMAVEPIS